MLRVEGLTKRFGGLIAVNDMSFTVPTGEVMSIVGPNGAGKTTALKLLIGQLTPTAGLISQNPRLRIGFFAQHHVDALDMNNSAVGFMSVNYPGKNDEEYRRHLGTRGPTGVEQRRGHVQAGGRRRH